MRALLFAYSEIGVTGLETLLDLGVEVVGVVTHADNPKEVRWFRSVADVARSRGLSVRLPEDPNDAALLDWAIALRPDILFSFYYRKLLRKPWLDLCPLGAYNLHGSLLPKFRGRACVNWAIIGGAVETGVTLHAMIERADAGDILGQERVPILEPDTARDVFEKLVPASRKLLMRLTPLLSEGRAPRTPQVEADATTFGARRPEDGRIDWHWPARRIHNWVRALARPYPGAFTFLGGKKLFIWKGHLMASAECEARNAEEGAFIKKDSFFRAPRSGLRTQDVPQPGQVLAPQAHAVPVVTGGGLYAVEEVQWEKGPVEPAQNVLVPQTAILGRSG